MEQQDKKRTLGDNGLGFSLKSCHELIYVSKTENGIFAYETNGLGSKYFMDDANVPVCVTPLETTF